MSPGQARDVPTTCLLKEWPNCFQNQIKRKKGPQFSTELEEANVSEATCGQSKLTHSFKRKDSKGACKPEGIQGTAVTITSSDNTAPNLW